MESNTPVSQIPPLLSSQDIEILYLHAQKEYPDECCGVIIGPPETRSKNIVCECTNIQNQLHQKDPATYPRDAKTAYCVDPREFMTITQKTEKNNMTIKALYHSHPDHNVYFSEEDKKNALLFDAPLYPEALYIVISVYKKKITGIGFFQWDEKEKDFNRLGSF